MMLHKKLRIDSGLLVEHIVEPLLKNCIYLED